MTTSREKVTSILILISLFSWVLLSVIRHPLPKPSEVLEEIIFEEPIQNGVTSSDITKQFPDYTYNLHPVADYTLKGVVVSQHNTKSFTDISHEFDSINTKDLCLVWGENISNKSYRKVRFSSGDFTCYWRWNKPIDPPFVNSSGSNNHIIPATKEIKNSIDAIGIGDQIELTGKLVSYKITDNETGKILGERGTSTTREDTGNGACEVVYVTNAKILRKNVPWWNPLQSISKYTFIVSFVTLLFFLSRPIKH